MIEPPPAHDIAWDELLAMAARVGVRVWRYDKKQQRLVVIVSVTDIEETQR